MPGADHPRGRRCDHPGAGRATAGADGRTAATQEVPAPQPTQEPAPQPAQQDTNVYYKNCAAVRAAGKAPLYQGQPGYSSKLDRDGDGIACE